MNRKVKVINKSHSLPLPSRQTDRSEGMDLMACFDIEVGNGGRYYSNATIYSSTEAKMDMKLYRDSNGMFLFPRTRAIIPTGLMLELPEGTVMDIMPRSGLGAKFGITIPNAVGKIDEDYRGMINLIIINLGNRPFRIEHGMRMAQASLREVVPFEWEPVIALSETDRGTGGLGSTGV